MKDYCFAKLDWFTVVLYNTSISDVLKRLHLDESYFDDMLSNAYSRSQGFCTIMVWSFNGVTFELSYDDYLSQISENYNVFYNIYAKIRLDISGSGLDFLRSVLNVDVEFTKPDFFGNSEIDYNITRCDFAFDFLNFKPEFLNELLFYIQSEERAGNLTRLDSRLSVGRNGGVQYSYRCGADQKTLYLGSPRGDRMVRIYDKYLENFDKFGISKKPDPRFKDINITSWLRIELQCRRKSAVHYLFNCRNQLSVILRSIFDDYLIRDKNGSPLPCMVNFYDWKDIPPIIVYSDFIQFEDTVVNQTTKYIKTNAWRSIYLFILRFGLEAFVNLLNCEMDKAFSTTLPSDSARYIGFHNKLSLMLNQEGITVEDLKGLDKKLFKQSNIIKLKGVKSK